MHSPPQKFLTFLTSFIISYLFFQRGDFQFKRTRISADEIYENTKDILEPGASIYIATDERDKKFFNPLKEKGNYDILVCNTAIPVRFFSMPFAHFLLLTSGFTILPATQFMDDFKHLLVGVNTNYYGMIDQLVASRGIKFFGCWHSTYVCSRFSLVVNRPFVHLSLSYRHILLYTGSRVLSTE